MCGMASIHRRGTCFHVKFSFQGKQFFRALKTSSKKEALHAKNRVEQNMHLITTGVLEIPANGVVQLAFDKLFVRSPSHIAPAFRNKTIK